jgi:hypothetical protein
MFASRESAADPGRKLGQGDASSSILPADDGSVISSGSVMSAASRHLKGRGHRCNFRLLRILPIVVNHNKRTITAVQVDYRIGQWAQYAEA